MLPRQVGVPEGLAGRPYAELAADLLRREGLLALGLYRHNPAADGPAGVGFGGGGGGGPPAFAWTNPPGATAVRALDRVFVLRGEDSD